MTPTKLLIGQIVLTLAIVICGMWAATQWAAAMLGYQGELGPAWFWFGQVPVYRPWLLFVWWYRFDAYAPHVFAKAGSLAAGSGVVACAAAVAGSLWRARQAANVTTYGSARWASTEELVATGLFGDAGVLLGRMGQHYLRHNGPEHVMAFAPTRSGKGVGLVVPTLLSWTGSTVVHDIKGENWTLTSGWRSRFSHCLLFNPTDPRSACYNPLLEVRRGAEEVRDVQNIADILVDPEGALERRNHWEKTSHSLLVGAILHVLYAEEEKTLARVATFLSDPQRSFVATLRRMMETIHIVDGGEARAHPVVASAARELLNKSENERSGVLSTAMSFLGLYRDPTVAALTARCDWRIADLVDAAHPISLYLVVPPSDISRTKPLNAVQVYPYSEGSIYHVLTAPGQVTDVALQPGETLGAVAAGDTVRWVIDDATSGAGDTKRTHVLVKPFTAGLTTNVVITTDRRTYHLALTSTGRTSMSALSWTYPQDQLIAFRAAAQQVRAAQPVASGLSVNQLHFDYAITGDQPAWRPLRAFDDGRQTFIEFPASLAVGEAPPLFLIDGKGTASLVNYRVQNRYYVVDRLFDTAELRLGLKHQDVVRISRTGEPTKGRRAS